MKRKLFSTVVTAGLFTSFTPAWAATCTTAPVSTYTAAGFSCNIGGLTFSNIVVTPTMLNGGSVTLTDFAPVNPVAGEFGLRLDHTASAPAFGTASVQWTYSVAFLISVTRSLRSTAAPRQHRPHRGDDNIEQYQRNR